MTSERMNIEDLRLLGGALCLDFVNSIENRAGHAPQDFLISYPDLVRWGEHAGLIEALAEQAACNKCRRRGGGYVEGVCGGETCI